ncbi:nucleoside 2-deoxyribosyltransferase [Paraburkholderia sp. UCT31]|uniref:nucleoside 2-deoxyribosyltransferase n=1 Tax=Paraburkholderia sp. UCT31 TaxID=2615209 RepID=UPI0016563C92|nr:nucleoside 2-deoxyribosyltransferase [Paraburkholderia sp. UCT31]MBC8737265.1 nucleoside 2-deoxyribosyltransferase [Paraburkholderia sp. UCT31]
MKIYLAGPDVFAPEQKALFAELKSACEQRGLVGVQPVDGGLSEGREPGPETAHAIYHGNIECIRNCDAVLANLSAFRGAEPDSGTSFEVGFAVALRKPVAIYIDDQLSYADRVEALVGIAGSEADMRCSRHGWFVENMGLPLNLMLACPAVGVFPTPEQAINALANILKAQTAEHSR